MSVKQFLQNLFFKMYVRFAVVPPRGLGPFPAEDEETEGGAGWKFCKIVDRGDVIGEAS